MSLIRIRGRTILAPILSEEERAEARALRERAVLFQRRLEEQRSQQLQHCNYQYQQQQQQSTSVYHQQQNTSAIPEGVIPGRNGLDNNKENKRINKNYNKNETRHSIVIGNKNRSCGETSSSSAPSSQGSGGELTSGLEDSPSAANVSVQTESSGSVTTSTDLHHYLNNSLDTSLDTSISVSHDIWHNSPSLIEVDEALLQTESPEVATNLILGRLHPSDILYSSSKAISSRQESQNTTTSSTLVQGHYSSEMQTISEGQDTTTMASVSLSFASVSEEGSEEGMEVLEVSEEMLDISEEDRDGSFPSEFESDVQRFDREDCQERIKSGAKDVAGRELDEQYRIAKEKWKEGTTGLQRDSGRGSSHSDYLDNYLELLTSRSSSSHGFHPTTSVSSCQSVTLATTYAAGSGILSTKVSEAVSPRNVISTNTVKPVVKPREVRSEENLEKLCMVAKENNQKDIRPLPTRGVEENRESSSSISKENDSIIDEIADFSSIEDDWQKELLLKPRASSATPERKERKRSRSRRWSSCQPLDPRRSVGSKYLDSYLGKLTDDAWLQYPTQLSDRRMVYLSSDEYINAVRPRPNRRLLEQQFTSTDLSENSASEENRNLHTSTESLQSSIPEGTMKETFSEKSTSLRENSVLEQPTLEQAYNEAEKTKFLLDQNDATSQDNYLENNKTDIPPLSTARSESQPPPEATVVSQQLVNVEDNKQLVESVSQGPRVYSNTVCNISKASSKTIPCDNRLPSETENSEKAHKEQNERVTSQIHSIMPDKSCAPKDVKVQNVSAIFGTVLQKPCKSVTEPTVIVNGEEQESQTIRSASKNSEVSDTGEYVDDGQDSSSDDSSETEPSTIVYLEDFPVESPGEGKTLLSTDSEEQAFLKAELSVNEIYENDLSSVIENGVKIQRKDTVVNVIEPTETNVSEPTETIVASNAFESTEIMKSSSDQNHVSDHSIRLVTSQKTDRSKAERFSDNAVTSLKRDNEKQSMFELDIDESEEECLVVQVIVDEARTCENHKPVCDIATIETKKKNEFVKDIDISNGSMQDADIANSEMELAQENSSGGWELVPEQISKDAMGQVLTLLKAKQQQELEELRVRQEEEIHKFMEKLQQVSPQQLHAFLSASDKYVSPKDQVSKSPMSPQGITNSDEDFHIKNEKLEVMKPTKAVSPQRNTDIQKRMTMNETDDVRVARNVHEDGCQSTVPCVVYPNVTRAKWSSPSQPEFVTDSTNIPPTCLAISLQDYPSCISDTTYPTSSLPLNSESMSSSAHSIIIPDSHDSMNPLESPKPRPSNHTNLMPSYFMYEENRICNEMEKGDNYKACNLEQCSAYAESITRPQSMPQTSSSLSNADYNVVSCSAHRRNNNPETVDTMSYINGNCLSYGDGMQYYRLFTGDEDSSTAKTTSHSTQIVSSYQPQTTETVVQPGLFKVIGNSPRPTSITSLLKEHPEMFGEEVLEVNVEHEGDWSTTEAEYGEHCGHPRAHASTAHHPTTTVVESEGGLDMVPERENAVAPSHHLSEDEVFIRGIIRLQACVRRYLTQRLLRTKFVQEQLATLSEIAKLAQQFHRDILTDNIQKGDVDFHRTLYNQERLARDRIRRVFVALTIAEQMSLINRDRQLWQLQQDKRRTDDPRTSPARTKLKNRYQDDRQRSTIPTKPSTKRASPPGPRTQQESKTRAVSGASKTTTMVQPTLVRQPQIATHTRSTIRPDYRLSPRGSRLPVQVTRSSSNLDNTSQSHYHRSATQVARSPSQDSRSSLQGTSRSGSNPSRSNSTSRLCTRTGAAQSPRSGGHVASTGRTCTIRNASNRVTPPRAATKTSIVGRKPWR